MTDASVRPLKVAIVGSGPSGFYAAEELLRSSSGVEISMIERLPVPFGLVRSGVAPDHPKLKQPILVYDRIGRSPQLHFFGHVHVDRDVSVADLVETHHAVVFACGADSDCKLDLPGEDLNGSYSATQFVGWYNGHPDYRSLAIDLSHEVVAIVGQGNVALDVARILAKPVDALRHTDIAEHALDALSESRVKEIHVIGRRGPAQARFTSQELNEFSAIPGCAAVVDSRDLELDAASRIEAADKMSRNIAKNLEILGRFAASDGAGASRRCHFHFFRNPQAILGETRVEGVRFAKTKLAGEPFKQAAVDTGESWDLSCGLLFRSIGYRGSPIRALPFDARRGVLRQRDGRLVDESGAPLYGLYATGWIKRGPSGIIGTNRADSVETVATLLADLPRLSSAEKSGATGLAALLASRGRHYVNYEQWTRIDELEVRTGQARGKPREKLTRIDAMLAVSRGDAAERPLSVEEKNPCNQKTPLA